MRALVWILLVCLSWSAPLLAQTTIQITSPESDQVETPFTLIGTAPPGAKLIIHVDGEVYSRIRADASGAFNVGIDATPTNEGIDVTVTVDGTDTTVARRFTIVGAAKAEAVVVPEAPDTPEQLAEVPPEPPDLKREAAPTVIKKRAPPKYKPGTRIAAESLAAFIAIGGSSLIGIGLGVVLTQATQNFNYLGFGVVGSFVVALILQPLLVTLTGNWMQGNGKMWAAYVGEGVGLALAIGLGLVMSAALIDVDTAGGTLILLTAFFLPTIGTIAGYELSTRDKNDENHEEDSLSISPLFNVQPAKTGHVFSLGLRGQF